MIIKAFFLFSFLPIVYSQNTSYSCIMEMPFNTTIHYNCCPKNNIESYQYKPERTYSTDYNNTKLNDKEIESYNYIFTNEKISYVIIIIIGIRNIIYFKNIEL